MNQTTAPETVTAPAGRDSSELLYAVMDGMEQVNRDMARQIEAAAPVCHFRKMDFETSDSVDGHYEQWWSCSICGHTKGR